MKALTFAALLASSAAGLAGMAGLFGLAGCKQDNPAPDVVDARRVDALLPDAQSSCFDPGGSPAGCFRHDECEPTEDVHFLNSCTDGQCLPFDNAARLPLYNGGELPPIP